MTGPSDRIMGKAVIIAWLGVCSIRNTQVTFDLSFVCHKVSIPLDSFDLCKEGSLSGPFPQCLQSNRLQRY